MRVKKLLIKEPFKKIMPKGNYFPEPITQGRQPLQDFCSPSFFSIVRQEDFLREFYPSGHKINDTEWFPDKVSYKDDEAFKQSNGGRGAWVKEKVFRVAIPFQFIITMKQLVHLCGNNIKITSSNLKLTDEDNDTLAMFKQGWLDKNMEVAWWECAKGEKITGDVACIFFMHDGKLNWRVVSYLDGSILFPHYDETGKRLKVFARKFVRYGEDGTQAQECVEVFDDTNAYLFVKDDSSIASKIKNSVLEFFGLDGYVQEGDAKPHGFHRCPVAYNRSDGACWSMSQDLIDQYELSVSHLCESNKIYAFPILVLIAGDTNIVGNATGRPIAITSTDPDAKVDLLKSNNAAESFKVQLDVLLRNIFLGSFTVTPPEVKSGDLPGVTIKLIFSPALEHAMQDARHWNIFIDDMIDLFKWGYGAEKGMQTSFNKININGEITPYIHENTAEVINMLSQSVLSGHLSIDTAIEKNPLSTIDEKNRVSKQEYDKAKLNAGLPTIDNNNNDGMNAYNIAKQKQ